jgi:uncharacterized membrane protein YdbT with pleckstrin-like domain
MNGIPSQPVISVPALPLANIVPLFFTLVFIVWLIYTIVSFYHWYRYGDNIIVSLGAMGMHLCVSSFLAMYAVSGLH